MFIAYQNVTHILHTNPYCGSTRRNRYFNAPTLRTSIAAEDICGRCGSAGYAEATDQSIEDAWNATRQAARRISPWGFDADHCKAEIARQQARIKEVK